MKTEAIQFVDNPEAIEKIVDFVEATDFEVGRQESWAMDGTTRAVLDIVDGLWYGFLYEGQWLVKRDGRVTRLDDKEYQILFGED